MTGLVYTEEQRFRDVAAAIDEAFVGNTTRLESLIEIYTKERDEKQTRLDGLQKMLAHYRKDA